MTKSEDQNSNPTPTAYLLYKAPQGKSYDSVYEIPTGIDESIQFIVTTINAYAFKNCNISNIDFKTVKTIGEGAFYGAGLSEIYDLCNIDSIENEAFFNTDVTDVQIYAPEMAEDIC